MAAGLPIAVIESFLLPQWEPAGWAEARETIRECALKHSSCRASRLLQDERNSRRVLLISEWDSAEAFNQFVRESGVLWLERGQHPEMRGTFSIVEGGVERARRFSGAMPEESEKGVITGAALTVVTSGTGELVRVRQRRYLGQY
jgi:hypothetical protein